MKTIKPHGFQITSIQDLREWFHLSAEPVKVLTKIRREWMTNHNTIIINGTVHSIEFKNLSGGVWEASLGKI